MTYKVCMEVGVENIGGLAWERVSNQGSWGKGRARTMGRDYERRQVVWNGGMVGRGVHCVNGWARLEHWSSEERRRATTHQPWALKAKKQSPHCPHSHSCSVTVTRHAHFLSIPKVVRNAGQEQRQRHRPRAGHPCSSSSLHPNPATNEKHQENLRQLPVSPPTRSQTHPLLA